MRFHGYVDGGIRRSQGKTNMTGVIKSLLKVKNSKRSLLNLGVQHGSLVTATPQSAWRNIFFPEWNNKFPGYSVKITPSHVLVKFVLLVLETRNNILKR